MTASRRSLFFTGPRSVSIRERSAIDLAADELLVDTEYSAISPGTELLVYRGEAPDEMAADTKIDSLSGSLSYPLQYGYAAVGSVRETGSAVSDRWLGETVFGFNPHETHFSTEPDAVVAIPDAIDPAHATLLPTIETAISLVHDGAPILGERVVVFGQGPIGLALTAVLAGFPLERLVTVEPLEQRRAISIEMGADSSVHPDSLADAIDPPTGDADPSGADLVFEISGNPEALDDAVGVTGYDGRVVLGSWYGTKPVELNLGGRFHRSRIEVISSQVSTFDPSLRGRWTRDRRYDAAWEQLRSIDADQLLTDRVPFLHAERAYERLNSTPEQCVCALLEYDDTTLPDV
ncbi:zinc-dependent alcohol dehydrogenase [Halalkalirubrum salinum]|uniref:zinc-dependent alcohol dehydrogenase n=1 Tax=Halalkalirubrum salinum TaxID=2563889 RepID=UPI0010FBA879|nr:zinc-binding alcohol dehydrogenase [Halalkalirubrum salinum]